MTAETVDVFDLLSAEVATDAVRAVEDAIEAHLLPGSYGELDGEQGPAVVRALLDLGWSPPAATIVTPLGEIADT